MSGLITLDEAIDWGKRGELCDLMTEDDQWQVAEWLRQARGADAAARWYTEKLRDADRTIRKLLNENAKMRELVRQMHTCLTRPKAYAGTSQPYLIATECPYFTQGVCNYNSCGFERRMRELGVEVDDG